MGQLSDDTASWGDNLQLELKVNHFQIQELVWSGLGSISIGGYG